MLGKMSTIIIITLPSKQSPEKLNDLYKNRSHSVVEPEFNYRFSCLKALSCGPQILNMIDLETRKSDTILKSCPDWFSKGYIIHTIYSHLLWPISFIIHGAPIDW